MKEPKQENTKTQNTQGASLAGNAPSTNENANAQTTNEPAANEQKAKAPETESQAEARMDKVFAAQEKSVKQMLEEQPKVPILIPENPMNPGEIVPIGFNGVVYAIPVGQEFEVPKSIYETWKYSYDKTREANKKMDQILSKEIVIY